MPQHSKTLSTPMIQILFNKSHICAFKTSIIIIENVLEAYGVVPKVVSSDCRSTGFHDAAKISETEFPQLIKLTLKSAYSE
jgi:hypothetical protein